MKRKGGKEVEIERKKKERERSIHMTQKSARPWRALATRASPVGFEIVDDVQCAPKGVGQSLVCSQICGGSLSKERPVRLQAPPMPIGMFSRCYFHFH